MAINDILGFFPFLKKKELGPLDVEFKYCVADLELSVLIKTQIDADAISHEFVGFEEVDERIESLLKKLSSRSYEMESIKFNKRNYRFSGKAGLVEIE